MSTHQHAITQPNNKEPQECSIGLDRLSVCFTDPNPEHVKATYGQVMDDHYSTFVPGMSVTKNQRYMASCLLKLPLNADVQETVCFEVGPRWPGQASYRLDFNPSKLSKAGGLLDLMVYLGMRIDADTLEFFRGGKVTRCDVAVDMPGYHLEDFIVRTGRLQKYGLYSDRAGFIQTTYLGTPTSNRVVAYEKPIEGTLYTRLRLERRLKPKCPGYQVALLKNPFAGVQLLPADFSEGSGIGIPAQFIADSIRIGGLKRPLLALGPDQRKALKKAYKEAASLLPSLDDAWASWPSILASYGLGKELGAVPLMAPGAGLAVNCKPTSTVGLAAMQSTVLVKHTEGAVQP